MVIDVFLLKNTRTFLRDQIRRTFWRKFHVFNNPDVETSDVANSQGVEHRGFLL